MSVDKSMTDMKIGKRISLILKKKTKKRTDFLHRYQEKYLKKRKKMFVTFNT